MNSSKEWLSAAAMDIASIEVLNQQIHLTTVTAFHAQQAIEKSLKAVLEFRNEHIPKIHSLNKLFALLENDFPVTDYSIIDSLDSLYIESRYPAGLGYLPYGQPSPEEAKVFFSFAQEVFAKACAITGNDIPGQLFKWKV